MYEVNQLDAANGAFDSFVNNSSYTMGIRFIGHKYNEYFLFGGFGWIEKFCALIKKMLILLFGRVIGFFLLPQQRYYRSF